MQADKYRTSGRNDKKELVIESPLQYKDAAQADVEAENSTLVRVPSRPVPSRLGAVTVPEGVR